MTCMHRDVLAAAFMARLCVGCGALWPASYAFEQGRMMCLYEMHITW